MEEDDYWTRIKALQVRSTELARKIISFTGEKPASEKDIKWMEKELKWCKDERSDLEDILEVEDFLVNGPGKSEDVEYHKNKHK